MQCPFCKEEIKDDAIKCRYCGEWLDGRSTSTIGALKEKSLNVSSKIKNDATDVYQSIFGSKNFINPSNSNPLNIDDDLVLYGDYFIYLKNKIRYSDIYGIYYRSSSSTYNFANIKEVFLQVYIDSKYGLQTIFLDSSSMFVRLKKFKLIQNAQLVFSSRSFKSRLKKYLTEMNRKGFIAYTNNEVLKKNANIEIHKDGLLKVKGKSINLKDAKKSGTLGLDGMHGKSISMMSSYDDPYTIGAATGSGGIFSHKVIFKAHYDHDVIKQILSMVANDEIR